MFAPTADAPALSVVIPVYNAAAQLPATLDAIEAFAATWPESLEVVFVDDHSSEIETQLILEDFARRCAFARLLRNERNRGKGFSVTRGMLAARGRHRVFTDVDLAYPLDQVHRIVAELHAGADVAIACRVLPDSRYVMSPEFFHYLYTRHLMSRAFNRVVQAVLLPGILDTQAGLKGFTAAAAVACFTRATIPGFGFDIECLYVAQRHGLAIRQVPVRFRYDSEPTTVRFARDGRRMLRDVLHVKRNAWLGRYAPDTANATADLTPVDATPVVTPEDRSFAVRP